MIPPPVRPPIIERSLQVARAHRLMRLANLCPYEDERLRLRAEAQAIALSTCGHSPRLLDGLASRHPGIAMRVMGGMK